MIQKMCYNSNSCRGGSFEIKQAFEYIKQKEKDSKVSLNEKGFEILYSNPEITKTSKNIDGTRLQIIKIQKDKKKRNHILSKMKITGIETNPNVNNTVQSTSQRKTPIKQLKRRYRSHHKADLLNINPQDEQQFFGQETKIYLKNKKKQLNFSSIKEQKLQRKPISLRKSNIFENLSEMLINVNLGNQNKISQLKTMKTQFYFEMQNLGCSISIEHEDKKKYTYKPIIKDVNLKDQNQVFKLVYNYKSHKNSISINKLIQNQYFGVLVQNDQAVYFGELKNNSIKNGIGIMIESDSTFEGTWQDNQKNHGIQIDNIGVYIGSFLDNQKNGKGQFKSHRGQLYKGEWLNGLKHGKGVQKDLLNNYFNGSWLYGKKQGFGILNTSNGRLFEGKFKNNQKNGWGTEIFPSKDRFEGFYQNDRPNGFGKYFWNSGITYEGMFEQGFRHGTGYLKTNDNLFKGLFYFDEVVGNLILERSNLFQLRRDRRIQRFNKVGNNKLLEQICVSSKIRKQPELKKRNNTERNKTLPSNL